MYESYQLASSAPSLVLTEEMLSELLNSHSDGSIKNTLTFFADKKIKLLKDYVKKRAKSFYGPQLREEAIKQRLENKHITYGLGQNAMMLKVLDQTMDRMNDYRIMREAMSEWDQPLVFDMSWSDQMISKDRKSLFYKELPFLHAYNRSVKISI